MEFAFPGFPVRVSCAKVETLFVFVIVLISLAPPIVCARFFVSLVASLARAIRRRASRRDVPPSQTGGVVETVGGCLGD